MPQSIRQLTFNLITESVRERRREAGMRTEPIPARLTDLYVENVPVAVLDISRSGIGLKVEQPFKTNLPVLIECDGLLITGNVRHCMRLTKGGFLLGMKIHRIIDTW